MNDTHEHEWTEDRRGFICIPCGASEPRCGALLGHPRDTEKTLPCQLVNEHGGDHRATFANGSIKRWPVRQPSDASNGDGRD